MSEFRMSQFIIGLIGFSIIVALVTGALVHTASRNNLEFDNESIETYNKMEEMTAMAEDLRDEDQSITSNSDFDLLGDLFSQGRATLTITKSSIDIVQEMTDQATEDLNLGYSGQITKRGAITIIIVLVMFLFMAIIVKWVI